MALSSNSAPCDRAFTLAASSCGVRSGDAPPATTERLRVLIDPPLPGAVNMARDEALLSLVGQGRGEPTLRLYQWSPPTISLGYFQAYADYEALPPPAGRLDVVRRLTGGGAILHDDELTYSLTLPNPHRLVGRNPSCLYEVAHRALLAVLERRRVSAEFAGISDQSGSRNGPFFCFARRHPLDVVLGPGKLAGSAQRRTRAAVLQHGSILTGRRFDQQPAAPIPEQSNLDHAVLGTEFAGELASQSLLQLHRGTWTSEELKLADELRDKYAGPAWTRSR